MLNYNPDIIKGNIDYEIELTNKKHIFEQKKDKWNINRKHIVIFCFPENILKIFDEGYVYLNIGI